MIVIPYDTVKKKSRVVNNRGYYHISIKGLFYSIQVGLRLKGAIFGDMEQM